MIQQEQVKQYNKSYPAYIIFIQTLDLDHELDDWAEQSTQSYLSQFLIVDNNDIRWAQVTSPGGHQTQFTATCHSRKGGLSLQLLIGY